MKLSNGTEVIAKSYCEEDAEKIVRLIRRNFRGLAAVSLIPLDPMNYF